MSPEVIDLVAALAALHSASDPGPFYFLADTPREERDECMRRHQDDLKAARTRAQALLDVYISRESV